MSTARENESHEQWWAGLSQEERYLAIETVRLDQDTDYPHGQREGAERPTGERAEWLRGQPEYLERWAGAENIAQQDETGLGPSTVPDAHADTAPLVEDDGQAT
ncbi:MAG: hypothetical protein Q4F65_10985 [Propionibacteriaceae bacterium]|nr:hypothetical protein [Propionibacteriaceae bacterium]